MYLILTLANFWPHVVRCCNIWALLHGNLLTPLFELPHVTLAQGLSYMGAGGCQWAKLSKGTGMGTHWIIRLLINKTRPLIRYCQLMLVLVEPTETVKTWLFIFSKIISPIWYCLSVCPRSGYCPYVIIYVKEAYLQELTKIIKNSRVSVCLVAARGCLNIVSFWHYLSQNGKVLWKNV